MQEIIQKLNESYQEILIGINPQVDDWLFMRSPVPIVSILIFYLYFVLSLGPRLMEHQRPFEMKWLMVGYNAYQVLFCTWLCAQAFQVNNYVQIIFNLVCQKAQLDNAFAYALYRGAWWYFFSKVVDLLDTVFFVLRKKQNQVSFLHVYHHSITCLFSWGYLKYLPGEQGVVIGFLNSFVHIFMYFYYMLSAMGPQYRKYLWWKKYITWIQLIQFTIMLSYLMAIVYLDCKLHRALTVFFMVNVTIFLYLFSSFYINAYGEKRKAAAVAAVAAAEANGGTTKALAAIPTNGTTKQIGILATSANETTVAPAQNGKVSEDGNNNVAKTAVDTRTAKCVKVE